EQGVKLRRALGPIQTHHLAGDGGPPEPDQMTFRRQLGCGGGLGPRTVADLGLGSRLRNLGVELDEKFHWLLGVVSFLCHRSWHRSPTRVTSPSAVQERDRCPGNDQLPSTPPRRTLRDVTAARRA